LAIHRRRNAGLKEMERIERTAELSILRALAFAGWGICLLMIGLSFDPGLSFLVGAILTLLVAAILAYRALGAPNRDPRKTHAWIMLDGDYGGLSRERAQEVLGPLLQKIHYRYAQRAGIVGACLYVISALLRWVL
jgi:hypothetical protein